MNKYIQLVLIQEAGQPVNKTVLIKNSDIVSVVDNTTFRTVVIWDQVAQKEVVLLSSTALSDILVQGTATTMLQFVCNATSPYYAGLTVLLNPTRIVRISGTTGTSIRYLAYQGTNAQNRYIRLTSDTAAATTIAAAQTAFNGGSSAATWGSITGTLSSQTDLQAALDGKFNTPNGFSNQFVVGNGSIQLQPVIRQVLSIASSQLKSSSLTSGIQLIGPWGAGYAAKVLSAVLTVQNGSTPFTSGGDMYIMGTSGTTPQFTIPSVALTSGSAATLITNAIPYTLPGAINSTTQITYNDTIILKGNTQFATGDINYNLHLLYTFITTVQ